MDADLPQPVREAALELADGRTLGYAVFGHQGPTLLWFHGCPGGRRQVPPGARAMAAAGEVRVVGIERPGTGDSTPHIYANIRAYTADVDALLDALEIPACGVIGLSGGGPYALACAHSLERVQTCAVLGGVAPARGPEAMRGGVSTLARLAPVVGLFERPLGAALSLSIRAAHPLASPAFDLFMKHSRPSDREVFAAPGMKEMFLGDFLRASRSGLRSLIYDYLLFSREWGFALADIATPVHFWHGDDDPFVSLEHGQAQARRVPNSSFTLQPGQSHLAGLAIADEVVEVLLGDLARTPG